MTTASRLKENFHKGTVKYEEDKPLTEIFSHEVENPKMAWYVDYYTEDPGRYRVRHLAVNPTNTILMTNENKDERDPADLQASQWDAEDVAEWFTVDGSTVEHRWCFIFQHTTSSEVYGIHVEKYRVFAFGPASLSLSTGNLWEEYVEHGILGAIRACVGMKDSRLVGIVEDPDVQGQLAKSGLMVDYLSALAAVLDA
jgi:hypothetical protein